MALSPRRAVALALAALLGLALVLLAGPRRVLGALAGADPTLLALGFAAYASFFLVRGVRWRLLLQGAAPGARWRDTTSLSAFGWAVNSFVPLKAGDAARAAMLARRERAGFAAVAGTVAVERALDLLGLALALSLTLPLLAAVAAVPRGVSLAVVLAWTLPVLGLLALAVGAKFLRSRRARHRLLDLAASFADAAHALRHPGRAAALALLTAAVVALQIALFVLLIAALGPGVPASELALGVPLFLLGFGIALSPGHVGTYEASLVAVLVLLGGDAEALFPLAVAVHVLTTGFVAAAGALGLLVHRAGRPGDAHPAADPAALAPLGGAHVPAEEAGG